MINDSDLKELPPGLKETKDYDAFVILRGNRQLNKGHVKSLIQSMTDFGNMTPVFPVVVNDRMEVIDGQHRLEALRELKWPVYYRIEQALNIEHVRLLNTAKTNWTWRDYARSYAELGDENYVRFLNLIKHFDVPFRTLMYFTQIGRKSGANLPMFSRGEYKLTGEKQQKAFQELKMYTELNELAQQGKNTKFAEALCDIIRNPAYDHERMKKTLSRLNRAIPAYRKKTDILRFLEDEYNKFYKDNVRLF